MSIHKPVLLREAVKNLNLKKGDIAIDATLGGGGHSKEILACIGKEGKLIAFDQDQRAIEKFSEEKVENVVLINDNFANVTEQLEELGIGKVDAILADLGYSSDQLEDPEIGMSFLKEAPLDMRLNRKGELTAEKVVNEYSQEELIRIFRGYGEERYASRIARKLVNVRKEKRIKTTKELSDFIERSVPGDYRRKSGIHPATRIFQAIRIEVNRELENLEKFIQKSIDSLKIEGRVAIISFHSLEDRLVKSIFRDNAGGCVCPKDFPQCVCGRKPKIKLITRKPIVPSEEETKANPRARSAKLRVAQKI